MERSSGRYWSGAVIGHDPAPSCYCGQLASERESRMSKTDATDPVWVRCNYRRGDVEEVHHCRGTRFGRGDCDLPPWPVNKHHLDTVCGYRPAAGVSERIYGGSYMAPPSRQPFRRAWYAADRASQRRIAWSLTRDANSGSGEIDEDVIDNRQTHRLATYGGGWWD